MKRETVSKMLTKRIAEARRAIREGERFDDLTNILGGNELGNQYYINLRTDIEQLEYLIKCLNNFKKKRETDNGDLL